MTMAKIVEEWEAEKRDLNTRLGVEKENVQYWRDRTKEHRGTIKSLESRIGQLEEAEKVNAESVMEAAADAAAANVHAQERLEDIKELKPELDERRRECGRLNALIDELERKLAFSDAEVKRLDTVIESQQTRAAEHAATVNRLAEVEIERDVLKNEIETTSANHKRLAVELRDMTNERNGLKEDVERYVQALDDRKAEVDTTAAKLTKEVLRAKGLEDELAEMRVSPPSTGTGANRFSTYKGLGPAGPVFRTPPVLEDETNALLAERGGTHGDWSENARVSQDIKRAVRKGAFYEKLPDEMKEALDMFATKMCRIVSGEETWREPDHMRDVAGYARLAERAIEQFEKKVSQ